MDIEKLNQIIKYLNAPKTEQIFVDHIPYETCQLRPDGVLEIKRTNRTNFYTKEVLLMVIETIKHSPGNYATEQGQRVDLVRHEHYLRYFLSF